MVSERAPNVLPSATVSLHAPTLVIVEFTRTLEIAQALPVTHVTVEAQQHPPPELYTLYASLLI